MIYHQWGFTSSPFQTSSLPPDALGERLLVGRDAVVRSLMGRISSAPKIATIEGLNGVGKTSVVNVASYKLYKQYLDTRQGAFYMPCRKIFQLDPEQDVQTFIDGVFMEIAQTLIERTEDVKLHGHFLDTSAVNRWLNSPELTTFQGGIWILQGGMQKQPNPGIGFERSGLRKSVSDWLRRVYPNQDSGGVICTVDNLELLQSSEKARMILEQLRDELLIIPGIRWVLCGSLGIVHGVASSPRLEGYLHKPIEIGEIGSEHAKEILTSRIVAYSSPNTTPYLPIQTEDFESLYNILTGNTRSVLSSADDYCQWISDRKKPGLNDEKAQMFQQWLNEQAKAAYEAVRQALRPTPLKVFQRACHLQLFSPSDHADFGFNSIPAFRPHIRDLEAVGLLVSTQDEGDKRRKTIQVTPKGLIVSYHLKKS